MISLYDILILHLILTDFCYSLITTSFNSLSMTWFFSTNADMYSLYNVKYGAKYASVHMFIIFCLTKRQIYLKISKRIQIL